MSNATEFRKQWSHQPTPIPQDASGLWYSEQCVDELMVAYHKSKSVKGYNRDKNGWNRDWETDNIPDDMSGVHLETCSECDMPLGECSEECPRRQPCGDHYDCGNCSRHLDWCLEKQAKAMRKLVEALKEIDALPAGSLRIKLVAQLAIALAEGGQ